MSRLHSPAASQRYSLDTASLPNRFSRGRSAQTSERWPYAIALAAATAVALVLAGIVSGQREPANPSAVIAYPAALPGGAAPAVRIIADDRTAALR
jgi:hypothetical protein